MVGTREILFYRALLPLEATLYHQHLQRLDAADRCARFFRAMTDSALAAHCAQLSWFNTQVMVCFVDGTIRGAVEICRSRSWQRNHAELALSVERQFQGRGIGSELTTRALVTARNRLAERATMLFLNDNARVRSIVQRHNAEITAGCGEIAADFALTAPNPISLLQECWHQLSCYRIGQRRVALVPCAA